MADQIKLDGLEALIKACKGKLPVARVGILGKTNSRTGTEGSNATVGAAHEFGTTTMPQRSFLRMPLQEKLNGAINKSGLTEDVVLREVIKTRSVKLWLQKIGVLAEGIILEAFASNGFGKWAKWKNPDYKNNTGNVLVDTQQ